MKIVIAGAGAMGSRIGLYLSQSGQDVTLLDGWQEHIDAVQRHGLKVHSLGEVTTHPLRMMRFDEATEPADLVVLLTKAMQAAEVLEQLKAQGVITGKTKVLSLMNGLGHGNMMAEHLNEDQILLAVTMWTAGIKGPGEVILEGNGNIELGRSDGKPDEFVDRLNDVLNAAGLNSKVSDNILTSVWNKAIVNCCFNTYCSVTDMRIGEFGAFPQSDDMLIPLMKEIIAVADKRGAKLDFDAILKKFHATYSPEVAGLHYPSMHQDLARGRHTEVDYLTGKVSEYGREFGIPTPYCDLITHLVHVKEYKNDQQAQQSREG